MPEMRKTPRPWASARGRVCLIDTGKTPAKQGEIIVLQN